jgi:hypothetical protein
MASKNYIDHILQLPQRKLVISKNDIDLAANTTNEIFILMVEESLGSAGGRAGGSGNRQISRVMGFLCTAGICTKYFEVSEQEKVNQFDIPYSAVAMDIKLSTGKPFVVQGIVDPELINSYKDLINNLK